MTDTFKDFQQGLHSPATGAEPVSPNDDEALKFVSRALYVGGAGDVQMTLLGGQTVTLTGVVAGTIYPIRCTHIRASGTTATGLVSLV